MRILFLTYAHERGLRADAGGFRKVWELAQGLAGLGDEVLVLYPRLPGREPLTSVPARACPVVDVRWLRPVSAYTMLAARACALRGRWRPDVVYYRSGANILPALLRRVLGARLVLEVNADIQEFIRSAGARPGMARLFGALEAINARAADLIVAVTPGLADMIVQRYGIPAERVAVIPSGTDVAHFTPRDADEARRDLGLPGGAPVVGFLGLFYRHQGVETLLRALARLRLTRPDVQGLVVGDGVMRGAWEGLARELGLDGIVRFVGQVPYERTPAWVGAMDVVAAPFTGDRGETSPFKILDALACERPVVASDLPSVRPLAAASQGAVTLVPPDDPEALAGALDGLVADPGRRRALGRHGRAFVSAEHAWPAIARALRTALDASPRRRIPVLYVLQSLDIGGTQRQLLFLLRGLDRARFRPVVACDRAGELAPALEAVGATVVTLRGGRYRLRDPRGWLVRWWELRALVRRHRIALVHAQWPTYALFGTLAGWAGGARVRLLSIHGHWLRRPELVVLRLIGRLTTAIVEGTPGCIQALIAHGLPGAKFRLVDYGVDGAPYADPGLRDRARGRLGLPPDAFVVARVSRLFPDKGVGDVVEAAARLSSRAPAARFLIVGDGDERPGLEARAHELGVADRVIFTGFYADLHEVLAAADVLTMTSRIDELGLATLEALAAGRPVVAVQRGPIIAEAVEHDVNGLLLPPHDVEALAKALLALHDDPARRERMGRASRRRWEAKYSLEAFGRRMGALYAELLEAAR